MPHTEHSTTLLEKIKAKLFKAKLYNSNILKFLSIATLPKLFVSPTIRLLSDFG